MKGLHSGGYGWHGSLAVLSKIVFPVIVWLVISG